MSNAKWAPPVRYLLLTHLFSTESANRFDEKQLSRAAPDRMRVGFSLVELVIVVVIIAIIAAIAVPRISRGSKGGAEAALRADLAVLRKAIALYAIEHESAWPAADQKEATFIDQLTKTTDAAGDAGTTPGVHIYGPYLRSIPQLPVGPNAGATEVAVTDETALADEIKESKKKVGWVYGCTTGEIIANTDDLDENGVGYDTY